ncbi:MAG: DUF2971 domain-containing protein, partial [Proteobacteria bacterium]|nr:DUF2971 domain-containing protein [Pseudomonadota bacterium]
IYHYTTAVGLESIVRTQQLWATHMGYLNDADEHTGFFVHRLPKLLDAPTREAVAELMDTPEGRSAINSAEVGGSDRAIEDFKHQLSDLAREVTIDINEPYLVSCCSGNAHRTPHDGLLSQWRGYGTDGGYAIVFETAKLEEALVEREGIAFEYQFASFCDVDYDYPEGGSTSAHPERENWEADIQRVFKQFILTRGAEPLNLHTAISALSSRYKHHGFSEETEVRIVVIPIHDDVYKEAIKLAKINRVPPLKQRKPIKFRERGGVLIPYLELFGGAINGSTGKLPIQRILVGPHIDRDKRASAVRSMVKQCGMSVPVEVSGIPYLGR